MNDIHIANLALIPLEDGPLSSLNEASEAARLCKAALAGAIETVLVEHDWNCATRLSTLGAPLSQSPAHGFAYAYQLPPDCLRVQRLGGPGDDIVWKRFGREVHTDVTPGPDLSYTALIRTEDMDPACANAVAFRLSALIARKLTGSATQSNLANALAEQVGAIGASLDASEGAADVTDAQGGDVGWADDV